MNKKTKNNNSIIIIFIAIILILPLFVGFMVKHTPNFGTFGNASDWFSFWSNYLGAIIGVIGVFVVLLIEKRNEKDKEKIKTEEEVYNNFILKYYYPFSNYLDYLVTLSGHSRKLTIEQFESKLSDYIRNMLIDFKYASPSLKKKLKNWEYYDYYEDLKGDQKRIVQIQIAQELFIQTYTISESLNKQDLLEDFWIFFSILILYKTDAEDENIMFGAWRQKYFNIYMKISVKHPTENEQKNLCIQAYKIYSESDNDNKSEKLKKLFNIN